MIFLIIACIQADILLGQFQLTYINILSFYYHNEACLSMWKECVGYSYYMYTWFFITVS